MNYNLQLASYPVPIAFVLFIPLPLSLFGLPYAVRHPPYPFLSTPYLYTLHTLAPHLDKTTTSYHGATHACAYAQATRTHVPTRLLYAIGMARDDAWHSLADGDTSPARSGPGPKRSSTTVGHTPTGAGAGRRSNAHFRPAMPARCVPQAPARPVRRPSSPAARHHPRYRTPP